MNARMLLFLSLAAALLPAADMKILKKFHIGGPVGGWDYLTLDESARRVYISHATQVEVLDLDTGKAIGSILDTPGVHGIALVPKAKHGFTTNGRENKLSMFDLATLKTIKKIDVGKEPDGIYYDAVTNRIFTNNHGSHDSTVLDATTGEVVGTLALAGDGEQHAPGKNGLIWVASEDTAEIVAFDPKAMKVVKRVAIASAKTPTGMTYDAKTDRIFVACRENPLLIVIDATSGKEVAKFPIGTGADWAEFDSVTKRIFVSTGEGILNVFQQKSADSYEVVAAFKTQQSARTMALEHKTGLLYLPAADFTTTPPSDPSKKGTRKQTPESFNVLVVNGR